MLQNLLEQLTTLLLEQGDLHTEIKKLKDQDSILESKLDQIKTALIEAMPTDVYSTEFFTLTKKKDFDLDIKVEDLLEVYKKSQPDRSKIKEDLRFGIEVQGVVATPKITLTVRKK